MTYYLMAALIIAGFMGLSIWLSKSFWDYHLNRARGYISDLVIYNVSPIVPMMVFLLGYSIGQYAFPAITEGSLKYVLIAVGALGIFFIRRLPAVAAAQARMRSARDAYFGTLGKQ